MEQLGANNHWSYVYIEMI